MRDINRRKADKSILHDYEDLRNERRYPKLEIVAYAAKALFWLALIPVFFIPDSARVPYVTVWLVCGLVYVIVFFTTMIRWRPHGKRLQALAIVLGFLALIGGMLVGMVWLLDRFLA